jgi:murein DD-endopeptidase MepM/ murein hydrolase activator NlpD
MIKKSSACSPSPFRNLPSRSSLFSFGFTLLCLVLSISTASAQTRPKRTTVKSEERLRRTDDEAQAGENESGPPDDAKQAAQPSLVRKTSMTYSPRTENESVERPTLTNDIVIISRAPEVSPARRLAATKAGATPSNVPSIWPVTGPLRTGYGMRNDPFGGPSVEFHKGQDIAAPTGTPVNATADGVVVIAGWVKGYGNGIYIDHGNGISTRYGHLSRIDVVVGQPIKQGQHLGLVGSTGRSTGPHLHYEVRINGQAINPLTYLPPVATTTPPAAQ